MCDPAIPRASRAQLLHDVSSHIDYMVLAAARRFRVSLEKAFP